MWSGETHGHGDVYRYNRLGNLVRDSYFRIVRVIVWNASVSVRGRVVEGPPTRSRCKIMVWKKTDFYPSWDDRPGRSYRDRTVTLQNKPCVWLINDIWLRWRFPETATTAERESEVFRRRPGILVFGRHARSSGSAPPRTRPRVVVNRLSGDENAFIRPSSSEIVLSGKTPRSFTTHPLRKYFSGL